MKQRARDYLAAFHLESKGNLTVYVGAAPGVGKTYKMLADGQDMQREGHDIVIGYAESHGRAETAAMMEGLEQIPLRRIIYKKRSFYELDWEAIIERAPEIVIIDELAHTNVPGSIHAKRYHDIEKILDAGIHVWSAVNIQHIESVHDIVRTLTGIAVRERVPDAFLEAAGEIRLVDATPETVIKRMKEGKIYHADKIEQSLTNFFKPATLSALRELVLREIADDVDQQIERTSGALFDGPVGIHEKILVCVQYGPTAEKLMRRGFRMAQRLRAELYILTIVEDDPFFLSPEKQARLQEWEQLAHHFHAELVILEQGRKKPADLIVSYAMTRFITQILVGQSARSRWQEMIKGSIINDIMRKTKNIEIHIVADDTR